MWVFHHTRAKRSHLGLFSDRVLLNSTQKMADKALDSSEEEEPTISEDVVVTKYKMAGDMANRKYNKYASFFEREKKFSRSLT